MTPPRFHVPGATPGARIALPEHTAHHAREVLRLRAGTAVRVFDGAGSEYEATLDSVSRKDGTSLQHSTYAPRDSEEISSTIPLERLGDLISFSAQRSLSPPLL